MKFKVGDKIHLKKQENPSIYTIIDIAASVYASNAYLYTLMCKGKISKFPCSGIDDTCILYLEPNDILKELCIK